MDPQFGNAKQQQAGAPMWIVTFADLSILLMCFFVLILSFSELDLIKYKQIAGSMAQAFGVQREVKTRESPRGINVIAQEFSPGRPQPTVSNSVRQETTNDMRKFLRINTAESEARKRNKEQPAEQSEEYNAEQAKHDAQEIRDVLKPEIDKGLLDVKTEDKKIIVQIREKGSFPSGTAELIDAFGPVMDKIGAVLAATAGRIVVAGHTDNVPIHTAKYRSNWELSSSRAVTVLHALQQAPGLEARRFEVLGLADTRPVDTNETAQGRANNRRVEIMIVQGEDRDGGDLAADGSRTAPDVIGVLRANKWVVDDLIETFSDQAPGAPGAAEEP